MSRVFLISDLHFGHESMAKMRGFSSAEQHDEHIIEAWNRVVHKNDKVWILGDITMEDPSHYPLLSKLKGAKHVIMGNHDLARHSKQLMLYVDSIAAMTRYKKCWLTHCPVHPRELEFKVERNIHGHLHEYVVKEGFGFDEKIDKRYINVSCERVNYTPQLFDDLIK